ncbi:thiamine-binding protein [Oceanobacillus halotolerans]|uniref:thiamine-binding protein n=1 Tax=Oceanobacillus halotolerans TaxID=2663380 RepID=UPI0013DB9008|nr:thiamine-binding protein [Oceanobacillus halotolerans]
MANALVSVQIIPKTENPNDVYHFVDEAIAEIDAASVTYEVHSLETTMEGDLSELLTVIQQMNEKMVAMGASNVISQVKILYQPAGITMDTLTEKYQ